MRRRLLVVSVCLALAVPAAAAAAHGFQPTRVTAAATPAPVDHLVLVSGRDDHGMVELARVPLTAERTGGARVAKVPDGTLARAVEMDGTLVRVSTVEGAPATGWVDDYHLRGVLRLADREHACEGEQVVATELRGSRVLVHPVTGGPARWAERPDLGEVVAATVCAQGEHPTDHDHDG